MPGYTASDLESSPGIGTKRERSARLVVPWVRMASVGVTRWPDPWEILELTFCESLVGFKP